MPQRRGTDTRGEEREIREEKEKIMKRKGEARRKRGMKGVRLRERRRRRRRGGSRLG